MSLAVELIGADEQAEERRSRILSWILRIAGLATLGGAMWIILWIDNRPTGQTASASKLATASTASAHESRRNAQRPNHDEFGGAGAFRLFLYSASLTGTADSILTSRRCWQRAQRLPCRASF